ncbi:MAG: flagellar basal body-associated FliL family protein [Aliidiomarina sp.]|uniref:flagellar basal body-associated FliL family protein n=1 Tax=Aliidiomarina sp. TaxID=1872439 RepID=UPI0025C30F59|nr:flagellar basal body-associated FliL family protein [Aliidiomarina sp.]MCH8501046.1 flagellar basal body-associated FliL family protein [Aliidiomarina sp.]
MAKAQPQKKESGNKQSPLVLILTGLVVLLIAVVGLNTWLLMETRTTTLAAIQGQLGPTEQAHTPVLVKLEPLSVNLRSDQFGPRILYTAISLEVQDGISKDTIMANMAQVRSRLLLLLSGMNAEYISNHEGKVDLANLVKQRLSEPYGNGQEILIHDVLFTEFIVQ